MIFDLLFDTLLSTASFTLNHKSNQNYLSKFLSFNEIIQISDYLYHISKHCSYSYLQNTHPENFENYIFLRRTLLTD